MYFYFTYIYFYLLLHFYFIVKNKVNEQNINDVNYKIILTIEILIHFLKSKCMSQKYKLIYYLKRVYVGGF